MADASRRIVFARILSQIRQLTPLIHLPVPAQSKVRTARRPFFAFSRGFYGASITCPLMCSYLCISQASPLSNRTKSVRSATGARTFHPVRGPTDLHLSVKKPGRGSQVLPLTSAHSRMMRVEAGSTSCTHMAERGRTHQGCVVEAATRYLLRAARHGSPSPCFCGAIWAFERIRGCGGFRFGRCETLARPAALLTSPRLSLDDDEHRSNVPLPLLSS